MPIYKIIIKEVFMKVKSFDELLEKYNNKLNGISRDYLNYKMLIDAAVRSFFEGIKELDEKFVEYYLKNIDKENVGKNPVEADALHCFFLLAIKNTSTAEFLVRFFPEYLESEPIVKSSWRVIRWLQVLISWIIKPKLRLNNLPDAGEVLKAVRNIKQRHIETAEANLLDKVNSEMGVHNALSFIKDKFLEKKSPSLSSIPIHESLHRDWIKSYVQKFESVFYSKKYLEGYSEECQEIDTLLKYLRVRIQLLLDSDERTKLLNEYIKLQDFVFKKELDLFEKRTCEIKEFIKNKLIPENAVQISGIYNFFEGIKQRLKIICESKDEKELMDNRRNHSVPGFKYLLNLIVDQIQFYYESHRNNLDKQVDFRCGNNPKFYDILKELEVILYTNRDLFFHTTNQLFCSADFDNLHATLERIQTLTKEMENYAKKIDLKTLENDMRKLSQFILERVLTLQAALNKEIKEYNNETFDDPWGEEWEDDVSDICETSAADRMEQGLNKDGIITSVCSQSDSGISASNVSFLFPAYPNKRPEDQWNCAMKGLAMPA
jgi:hypothetical protein